MLAMSTKCDLYSLFRIYIKLIKVCKKKWKELKETKIQQIIQVKLDSRKKNKKITTVEAKKQLETSCLTN